MLNALALSTLSQSIKVIGVKLNEDERKEEERHCASDSYKRGESELQWDYTVWGQINWFKTIFEKLFCG